jgi:hypothetical protein
LKRRKTLLVTPLCGALTTRAQENLYDAVFLVAKLLVHGRHVFGARRMRENEARSMSSERQQDGYVPKMFLVSLKPDTGLSVISMQSVGWPNLEPLAMSPIEKVKEGLAMLWSIARDAAGNWSSHKDSRQGAALAYYSVFSIGPIIVIAIASPAFFSVVRR